MDYFQKIFKQYCDKGILIDSNLLLLYFIGIYDSKIIEKFKRTRIYKIEDFILLNRIVQYFKVVITTPNILTEISNLSSSLPENQMSNFYSSFANQLPLLKENYCPSSSVCISTYFRNFGLTDSVIIQLVKNQYLVLSDDLVLVHYLQKIQIDAINFNHLRMINWRLS